MDVIAAANIAQDNRRTPESEQSFGPMVIGPLDMFSDEDYQLSEATEHDAEAIVELVSKIDMTNAESFLWALSEMRERLRRRQPLAVLARHCRSGAVVGVAGIDVDGMEKEMEVLSTGSCLTDCPAGETFTVPAASCMCRGLLVDPKHQGAGLGSRLHKARIVLLAEMVPSTTVVVLGARGRTSYEEAMATLRPVLEQARETNAAPRFEKSLIFEVTYHTSKGVVHLVHQREREGWHFVGVDVADGGPVWMTSLPLAALVEQYTTSTTSTATTTKPLRVMSAVDPLVAQSG